MFQYKLNTFYNGGDITYLDLNAYVIELLHHESDIIGKKSQIIGNDLSMLSKKVRWLCYHIGNLMSSVWDYAETQQKLCNFHSSRIWFTRPYQFYLRKVASNSKKNICSITENLSIANQNFSSVQILFVRTIIELMTSGIENWIPVFSFSEQSKTLKFT